MIIGGLKKCIFFNCKKYFFKGSLAKFYVKKLRKERDVKQER